jgi:cysteine desulfurase / selenocysteine lyase
MDIAALRKDYPTLEHGTAYLDTAATSLTPVSVIEVMDEYYRTYRASVHRGSYAEAERATEAYENARAKVAAFIGASPEEVLFTAGATASSNMLTYALEHSRDWGEGEEVVTSVMEHHASLIPLQQLATRKGLVLRHIPFGAGHSLDYDAIGTLITEQTVIVSVMLASNVLGSIQDVQRIARRAHEVGATVIVDATAAVGHLPVDVRALEADFLFFSGHKMCGPTGIGVLYGKEALLADLEPGFFGGGIVEDVSLTDAVWVRGVGRFEAGSQNVAGAIGLGIATEYLTAIGLPAIHEHVRGLTEYAQNILKNVDGIQLFSSPPEHNVGTISFTLDGVHPHDIAHITGRHNVAIRAGHHCALPLHTELGIPATARASIYLYNTEDDIDRLVQAVEAAKAVFDTHSKTS